MNLEQLQSEMIKAMKNKDKIRKETISGIIQSVKKFGIDNKCKDNISEEQINTVILKEKKTMQEMIDTCPADRIDTLEEYKIKMSIINEFAPIIIDNSEDITKIIFEIGIDLIKTNRGKIMGMLKTKNVDMKIANKVLGELLV